MFVNLRTIKQGEAWFSRGVVQVWGDEWWTCCISLLKLFGIKKLNLSSGGRGYLV